MSSKGCAPMHSAWGLRATQGEDAAIPPIARASMVFEKLIRYAPDAVGLKPAATRAKPACAGSRGILPEKSYDRDVGESAATSLC